MRLGVVGHEEIIAEVSNNIIKLLFERTRPAASRKPTEKLVKVSPEFKNNGFILFWRRKEDVKVCQAFCLQLGTITRSLESLSSRYNGRTKY